MLPRDLSPKAHELRYFELIKMSYYRDNLFAESTLYSRKTKRVELFYDTLTAVA
jgi:hypothetical protein